MKADLVLKTLFLVFSFLFAYGQTTARSERNVHGRFSIDDIEKHLHFTIHIERELYEDSEVIPVSFHIHNKGFTAFRFYVHQEYGESFFLEIIDSAGKEIKENITVSEHEDRNIRRLQKNLVEDLAGNPVKEILLHPDETFSKVYYVKGLPEGTYTLSGYFLPYAQDPQYKKNFYFVSRNSLKLSIVKEKSIFRFDDEQDLEKDTLPSPEETVYLFLMAEYYKNWDSYFKYVELKDFILSYENYEKRYRTADTKTKQNLLNEFKNFLKNQPVDPIISFTVKEVHYFQPDVAKVVAEVQRGQKNYKVTYIYEYILRKKTGWKIHEVLATVVKTGR